jgi:hypothetical protein
MKYIHPRILVAIRIPSIHLDPPKAPATGRFGMNPARLDL